MRLENILLGVLLQHPSTGYDLKKFLDTTGRFLRSNTSMSQVYRCLGGMEERGWVTHSVEHRAGAQDAKTYRVTEEGATVFLDWLTSPYQPPTRFEDPDLGVRLAFAGLTTAEEVIRWLDVELPVRREEVARYRLRDRREEWAPTVGFDAALSESINNRMHFKGARAKDAHIAELERLRTELLDGTLPRWHDEFAEGAPGRRTPAGTGSTDDS